LVVLTEFDPVRSKPVADALVTAGLKYAASAPAGYGYDVFVASKHLLRVNANGVPSAAIVGGYLEVELPRNDLLIAGVYVPVISAVPLAEKRRFWAMLHEAARRNRDKPYLVLGDWNTGDFPLDKQVATRTFT
jgi:exonuclease III